MTFLAKSYQFPKETNGNYMKLLQGENRFRILSPAITGWIYWDSNNKAIRSKKFPENIPFDIKPKHFWCMKVYNYHTNSIQILDILQSTIQKEIKSLIDDDDWGEPDQYDIKIIRTGELKQTKYQVLGIPPSPISEEIKLLCESIEVNLEMVFTGGNPFQKNNY